MYVCMYVCIYLSIYLSLYIHIYIFIYLYILEVTPPPPLLQLPPLLAIALGLLEPLSGEVAPPERCGFLALSERRSLGLTLHPISIYLSIYLSMYMYMYMYMYIYIYIYIDIHMYIYIYTSRQFLPPPSPPSPSSYRRF